MTEAERIQELNNRIGEQILKLMQSLHGAVRPFILLLPPLIEDQDPRPQALTNISDVSYMCSVLKAHLQIAGEMAQFDHIPQGLLN